MNPRIASGGLGDRLMAMLGDIRAEARARGEQSTGALDAVRFVTISRQAGVGAKHLAAQLADRLNARFLDGPRWMSWDRELVEKVAKDYRLSSELIDSLTEHSRSWHDQLLADIGSAVGHHVPDDFRIYHEVAAAIRALAQRGRVIVVGRGGMCVTRDMPGGLHVRLVAPLEDRIAAFAARNGIPRSQAAGVVRDIDRGRENFYRHFFPKATAPDAFSATFNTAALSEAQVLSGIVALIDSATAPAQPVGGMKWVGGEQTVG